MKRQCSIKIGSCIKFLAALLMIGGVFLNSACAVAEGPVPFNAMMQSSSAEPTAPPKPDSPAVSGQQVNKGHVTKLGGTEIALGSLLLGAGIFTIALTAAMNSPGGIKPSGAKTPAAYAAGAGASAAGVTLIAFGFHKRSTK